MTIQYHYTKQSILAPNDPVDVLLIGAGGTGSQVLTGLGQINHALMGLGHNTGLRVTVADPDTVSDSNVGRQLFSPVDIGENKARILVERVNRFYGIHWLSYPFYFDGAYIEGEYLPDIVISCVDTVKARREIKDTLETAFGHCADCNEGMYWLDTGNSTNSGQVILSTIGEINQDENTGAKMLPNIFDFFPDMDDDQFADQPSCSMSEALNKQDLFINRTVANYALDLIWRLFRYAKVEHHGCFVNLDNYMTRPVSVKNSHESFYQLGKVT